MSATIAYTVDAQRRVPADFDGLVHARRFSLMREVQTLVVETDGVRPSKRNARGVVGVVFSVGGIVIRVRLLDGIL